MSVTDRRSVRREATIDEILAVATELMAADGPGSLSLAEVARRVGMRPPSLYQYFPSKLALYDEFFARGASALAEAIEVATRDVAEPIEALRVGAREFVRWAVTHPVQAQILFWRPVPGYRPSEAAYGRAVASMDQLRSNLRTCVELGLLARDAASDRGVDLITTLISGVVSQQLANEPGVTGVEGRFASLTDELLDMFLARFAPSGPVPARRRTHGGRDKR